MPGNVTNTLYPPVIATFMPAFDRSKEARVYFSISPFNSIEEINRVHVSLQNQLSNENAFFAISEGVMILDKSQILFDPSSGMYYITISGTDVSEELLNAKLENAEKANEAAAKGETYTPRDTRSMGFNINQFYKVQLRFDKTPGAASDIPSVNSIQMIQYLFNNVHNFSEWSTVCLLRAITRPTIRMRKLQTAEGAPQKQAFNKGIVPLSGFVYFDDTGIETETLESFRIEVLSETDDTVLLSSKEVYTSGQVDPNAINYYLDLTKLKTSNATDFRLKISITTVNQYKTSQIYDFQISEYWDEDSFQPEVIAEINNDTGLATIKIHNDASPTGIIHVSRLSSLDNYQSAEEIYSDVVKMDAVSSGFNITIEDPTVQSLAWYKYHVQLENSKGNMTIAYKSNTIFPEFYDAIISRDDKQLCFKYNYKISNVKPVVNRVKVDTLGGKYPKFTENAAMNYKQFSITGLLSATIDMEERFLNRKQYFNNIDEEDGYLRYTVYGRVKDGELGYKDPNSVNTYLTKEVAEHNDYFWEREFREAATEWLNDGLPKLYRSMTEGSMVIMLTDVSLTPNPQLSRRVWDFSATAYEIADTDLASLDALGIYNIHTREAGEFGEGSGEGENEDIGKRTRIKPGQLYNYPTDQAGSNDIVANIIRPRLEEAYAGVLSNREPNNFKLKNVKLFFTSPPRYYIENGDGSLRLLTNLNIDDDKQELLKKARFGYVFYTRKGLNSKAIFVNERGFYQIPSSIEVTELFFDPGQVVTIEYGLEYEENNTVSTVVSATTTEHTVLGQYQARMTPNKWIGEIIKRKYTYVQPTVTSTVPGASIAGYKRQMQYWKGISIEADPYTMVRIQYKGESNTNNSYMIGETGILYMLRNVPVQDMCFEGKRFIDVGADIFKKEKRIEKLQHSKQWEYLKVDTIKYAATSDITDPLERAVYTFKDNTMKIYYQHNWYDFQETPAFKVNSETVSAAYGIGKVPVDAMVNYVGDVIKVTF